MPDNDGSGWEYTCPRCGFISRGHESYDNDDESESE